MLRGVHHLAASKILRHKAATIEQQAHQKENGRDGSDHVDPGSTPYVRFDVNFKATVESAQIGAAEIATVPLVVLVAASRSERRSEERQNQGSVE